MARCSAARADYFRHIYVWTDIWQMAGYSAVIYLAALASIDTSRYDAAKVGGANRLQKIIHVDIPGIMPTAIIILILGVGNVMQRTKGKSMDASNRSRQIKVSPCPAGMSSSQADVRWREHGGQ